MSDNLTLYIGVVAVVIILLIAYHSFYGGSLGKIEIVLMFYRPGCHWCDEFKPEMDLIESKLGQLKAKKINAADPNNAELVRKFKVDGVPSIIFVDVYGRSETYNGSRKADLILSRMAS